MTARAAARDRQFIDDLPIEKIRGYARPHTLTIELGGAEGCAAPDLLLLTGWTDYAFSSDNVAAHQAGLAMQPPSLAVLDNNGQWQTVIDEIGIPVGRPQTIAVDLSGQWLSASREVRISTSMRIYWDQIQVASRDRGLTLTGVRRQHAARSDRRAICAGAASRRKRRKRSRSPTTTRACPRHHPGK